VNLNPCSNQQEQRCGANNNDNQQQTVQATLINQKIN